MRYAVSVSALNSDPVTPPNQQVLTISAVPIPPNVTNGPALGVTTVADAIASLTKYNWYALAVNKDAVADVVSGVVSWMVSNPARIPPNFWCFDRGETEVKNWMNALQAMNPRMVRKDSVAGAPLL